MKYTLLTLLIPSLVSCALANNPVQKEQTIRPGEVRFLEFEVPAKGAKLFCRNEEIKLNKNGNKLQAVVIESYFSDLKP
jgi:hypothetical protein